MKRSKLFLPIVIIMLILPITAWASPKRIISMTPVGTEILFALGQGDSIIGVTNFCDYPPEAT
ncbi:MAG: iron ABC transporter, partial [Synergistaceae bacterium]